MIDATSDLFQKIRQEHQDLGIELGNLRHLLSKESGEINPSALVEVLDRLRATLGRHFRFEEEGGYLTQVANRFPNWSTDVERLRQEHRTLRGELEQVCSLLGDDTRFTNVAGEVCDRLNHWLAKLSDHEHRENQICQEAFNLDVGQGD